MAKTEMLCPFNERVCDECALYRGRHYYLSLCEHYRGYIGERKVNGYPEANGKALDMETFDRLVSPWTVRRNRVESMPDIRLKVIDMETEELRTYEPEEARNWDWGNTEIMRMIDGFHITTWAKLNEVLQYKGDKGFREVELYEGPRFMLLGGG